MPAPKGHARYGGRVKGQPNKSTRSLFESCDKKGINPFEALLDVVQNAEKEETRLAALKEVCSYLYPKRKAIEHSGLENLALVEQAQEFASLDRTELLKIAQEELKEIKGKK